MSKKVYLYAGLVCLLIVATVFAATTVTVTKTSSRWANALNFDGTYYTGAYVQELNSGYMFSYYVYDYSTSPVTILEQGYGQISSSDASIGQNGASVDVDTTSIAIVGSGGRIKLTWTTNDVTAYETSSKYTSKSAGIKTISFGGISQASATATGTFLGDDFDGTGAITTNKGKVITQTKN